MRKVVVLLLTISLLSPAVSAQGLMASVDRAAARIAAEAAQEADQPMVMGMRRTHFGLGLGLLAGGGGALAYMAATQGEECTEASGQGWYTKTCVSRTYTAWAWAAAAGGMAAGAVVWIVGRSKAKKVAALTPDFVPVRGGWSLQKTVTF